MSQVRIVFHKPRLAALLDAPGGLPVAEALARAQANLDEIRPVCVADMQALLERCEIAFASMGAGFDDHALAAIYAIAVKGIGAGSVCGVPGVDDALSSLCDLLDSFRTAGRSEREAVAVHIRAWRLLMTPNLPSEGRDHVLSGLRKVTARSTA